MIDTSPSVPGRTTVADDAGTSPPPNTQTPFFSMSALSAPTWAWSRSITSGGVVSNASM